MPSSHFDESADDFVVVSDQQLQAGMLARLAYSDRDIVVTGIIGTLLIATIFAWTAAIWQVAVFVFARMVMALGSHWLSQRLGAIGPEEAILRGYAKVMDAWMAAVALSWASVIFFAPSPVFENSASVLGLVAVIAVEGVAVLVASVSRRSIVIVLFVFWACLSLRVLLDDHDTRLPFLACNLLYHLVLGMHAFNLQRQTVRQVHNEIANRLLLERVTQLHTRVREHRDDLARVNLQLHQSLELSTQLANRDALTQTLNRRAFLQHMADRVHPGRTSLVLLDLDEFKAVNDQYGHLVGDKVLAHCADVLRSQMRAGDVLARWGGEEFIILLPNTTLEEAKICAERCRAALADAAAQNCPVAVTVTASFGVAALEQADAFHEALTAADAAMYRAKAAGRNTVRVAATA